ncbi:hypothetical protein B0H11DRAFT_2216309 [Mycena galericulata]|nr:hypothetical protein B0H11DRAFT_2216309 [Mycena galericulata]
MTTSPLTKTAVIIPTPSITTLFIVAKIPRAIPRGRRFSTAGRLPDRCLGSSGNYSEITVDRLIQASPDVPEPNEFSSYVPPGYASHTGPQVSAIFAEFKPLLMEASSASSSRLPSTSPREEKEA